MYLALDQWKGSRKNALNDDNRKSHCHIETCIQCLTDSGKFLFTSVLKNVYVFGLAGNIHAIPLFT